MSDAIFSLGCKRYDGLEAERILLNIFLGMYIVICGDACFRLEVT